VVAVSSTCSEKEADTDDGQGNMIPWLAGDFRFLLVFFVVVGRVERERCEGLLFSFSFFLSPRSLSRHFHSIKMFWLYRSRVPQHASSNSLDFCITTRWYTIFLVFCLRRHPIRQLHAHVCIQFPVILPKYLYV
jgi:hypothetical protein